MDAKMWSDVVRNIKGEWYENRPMVGALGSGDVFIYEMKFFLGRKFPFRCRERDLTAADLKISNISLTVNENTKCYLYGEIDMRGHHITFTSGDYPDLQAYTTTFDRIGSLVVLTRFPIDPIPCLPSPEKGPSKCCRHWSALGDWFLGQKAENMDFFLEMVTKAFKGNQDFRQNYFPADPSYIKEMQQYTLCSGGEESYGKHTTNKELEALITRLKNSVPTSSNRFQGHMNWDCVIPGFLGYLAALLYNANNVANEASPVTTKLEIEVGEQLCTMLGYRSINNVTPWGHITSCGSVANIEAAWASTMVKFYPLAVKKALEEDEGLSKARSYTIFVPRKKTEQKLVTLDQWELLNLNHDDVIRLPEHIPATTGVNANDFINAVRRWSLEQIGWMKFVMVHRLTECPVFMTPRSCHYSWPKAGNMLGIGEQNMIGVAMDENARMSGSDLHKKLIDCLHKRIPVISVVAVIGTTEESAVDPLGQILDVRSYFQSKGLNFAINADAAWGGYFMSMLNKPELDETDSCSPCLKDKSFVPVFAMSNYTRQQLECLKHADTITIDPHKSGFCPYPAGGLCYRNGKMKDFITIHADVVYHTGKDPSVGTFGIDGSKPGAAAASVWLAHTVLGLNTHGYGQILGQCVLGGKLFYCLWLTLAKGDDEFVCVPMKPMTIPCTAEIIRRILDMSNEELYEDREAMEFLGKIGPDTVINAFAVNKNGNKSLELCNQITFGVFEYLSHSNELEGVHRVPMILTQSQLSAQHHDKTCEQFKRRLGIDDPKHSAEGLNFLINTVMNPWITYKNQIKTIGKVFRQTVLNVIGEVTDPPVKMVFLCFGTMSEDGQLFGIFLPQFETKSRRYHAVVKFQFRNDGSPGIRCLKEELQNYYCAKIVSVQEYTLGQFLKSSQRKPQLFSICNNNEMPTCSNEPQLVLRATIVDVPRYQRFDRTVKHLPEKLTYFLFGEGDKAYMSHNMTGLLDFLQVVELDAVPCHVTPALLKLGINVTLPDISRIDPHDDYPQNPLQKSEHRIEFVGENGQEFSSKISIGRKEGKIIYFDSADINHLDCTMC